MKVKVIMGLQFGLLIAAAAGVANCFLLIPLLVQFYDAPKWPEVEAQIIESHLDRSTWQY